MEGFRKINEGSEQESVSSAVNEWAQPDCSANTELGLCSRAITMDECGILAKRPRTTYSPPSVKLAPVEQALARGLDDVLSQSTELKGVHINCSVLGHPAVDMESEDGAAKESSYDLGTAGPESEKLPGEVSNINLSDRFNRDKLKKGEEHCKFDIVKLPNDIFLHVPEYLDFRPKECVRCPNRKWLILDPFYALARKEIVCIEDYSKIDEKISENIRHVVNLNVSVGEDMPESCPKFWKVYGKDIKSVKIEFEKDLVGKYVSILVDISENCPVLKSLLLLRNIVECNFVDSIPGGLHLPNLRKFVSSIDLLTEDLEIFDSAVKLKILDVSLTSGNVKPLVNILKNNGNDLTEFHLLDHSHSGAVCIPEVLHAIKKTELLTILDLYGYVDDLVLLKIWDGCRNLKRLSIEHDPKHACTDIISEACLMYLFLKLPLLTHLRLWFLHLSSLTSRTMAALKCLNHLQNLDVGSFATTARDVAAMFNSSVMPKITDLRLSSISYDIGDAFVTVAPLLSNIRQLHLADVGLSYTSLQAIFKNNRKLKVLNIDASNINESFGVEISASLTDLWYLIITVGKKSGTVIVRNLCSIRLNKLHTIKAWDLVATYAELKPLFDNCPSLQYVVISCEMAFKRGVDVLVRTTEQI